MLAVRFYDVAVALHVMAILIAFGAIFAYPVLTSYVLRNHPRAVPALYGAMNVLGRRIISPMGGVALLLGIYLASDADVWSEVWVTVPLIILIAVLGLGGAVFSPAERRVVALAESDVAAAREGEVVWGERTQAEVRRLGAGYTLAALLVLVAVFFMVVKP